MINWWFEPADMWSGYAGDQDHGSNVAVFHSAVLTLGTIHFPDVMDLILTAGVTELSEPCQQ